MKGVVLSEEVIVLTYTTHKDAFLELTIPWMGTDNEKSNAETINYIICKVVSLQKVKRKSQVRCFWES